jgi:YfiH family protein
MTDILTSENLESISHLRHAFFTRGFGNGGVAGHENASDVHISRGRMALRLGVSPQNLLSVYQIHSPDVVTVTEIWSPDNRPKADGMVTDRKGIALGVLTADCVPVLFADRLGTVIGAAHAGWRGAIGGVLDNTLTAMEALGARRQSIYAALGPCIWQNSYEVGPEFPALFLAENPENENFFRPVLASDHYMFDLPGYVVAKLRALGVGSVDGSGADTCADPGRFFSHRYSTLRHEKRAGNLMSAIVLTG